MRPRSMAKELKGTVKEILGTAKSTGCTVEGEDPQDVQQSIEDGDIEVSIGAQNDQNGRKWQHYIY